jgi:hypothetical protein
MFSRGMADSSRYSLYKRSVWPKAKTIKLHKYLACRISPKYNNLVWHAVRGTAYLWPWSWHSYGPIWIKFWTGQRGLLKASNMKFQQNVWNLSWNVLKHKMMAFNEVGFVIISIIKNTNGRLALCKGLSCRVTQNFCQRQLHYLSALHEKLENKPVMNKSVCCIQNTLTHPN